MIPDGLKVLTDSARVGMPGVTVVTAVPADWVSRVPLLVLRGLPGGRVVDSRFDFVTLQVQVDAYAASRIAACALVSQLLDVLRTYPSTAGGRVNGDCDLTPPVELPEAADGVHRVTSTLTVPIA